MPTFTPWEQVFDRRPPGAPFGAPLPPSSGTLAYLFQINMQVVLHMFINIIMLYIFINLIEISSNYKKCYHVVECLSEARFGLWLGGVMPTFTPWDQVFNKRPPGAPFGAPLPLSSGRRAEVMHKDG